MPQEYDEVAGVYARSLYELAHEAGGLDKAEEVYAELDAIVEMSRADPRLRSSSPPRSSGRGTEQALRRPSRTGFGHAAPVPAGGERKGRLGELLTSLPPWTRCCRSPRAHRGRRLHRERGPDRRGAPGRGEKIRSATGKEPVYKYSDPSMIGGIKLLIG